MTNKGGNIKNEIANEDEIKHYYAKVYSESDISPAPFLKAKKHIEYLIQLCPNIDKNKTILDIGCGTGYYTNILSKIGFKHVVGVDISDVAIEKAKRQYPDLTFIVNNSLTSDKIKADTLFARGFRPMLMGVNNFIDSVDLLFKNTGGNNLITFQQTDLSGNSVGDHYGNPIYIYMNSEEISFIADALKDKGYFIKTIFCTNTTYNTTNRLINNVAAKIWLTSLKYKILHWTIGISFIHAVKIGLDFLAFANRPHILLHA